jgi:hypothetical protein
MCDLSGKNKEKRFVRSGRSSTRRYKEDSIKYKSVKKKVRSKSPKNKKRKRDEYEQPPKQQPNKKRRLDMRSKSQEGRVRSNSRDSLGKRLPINKRHSQIIEPPSDEFNEDHSVIAVYSREASKNFSKKFHKKMEVLENRVTQSSLEESGIEEGELEKYVMRQDYTTVSTRFHLQIKSLLKNKMLPHAIAVIEGKGEKKRIEISREIEGEDITLKYRRVKYFQGKNSRSKDDDKQSIAIYVRNDLLEAYTARQVTVEHPEGEIN